MSAKHTPGPWSATADPYPNGIPYFQFTAGNAGYGEVEGGFSFTGIMQEADARLIAAAPELLEALKEAISEWEDWPNDKLSDAVERNNSRLPIHKFKMVLTARAAIAKAEGTAP